MKDLKANEILKMLNKEMAQDQINELYKAMIAYSIGFTEVDAAKEKILDTVIEQYFENDDFVCFINEDLYYMANNLVLDDLDYAEYII